MTREKAVEILSLPQNATAKQIETAYRRHLELYYPPFYGWHPGAYQAHNSDIAPDPGTWAFIRFWNVHEAYQYLTDPNNKNDQGVDPGTAYGYDVLRYGVTVAKIRKTLGYIALISPIFWILRIVIALVFGIFFSNNMELGDGISNVLWWIYCACWVGGLISAPLDTLLVIPIKIWNGLKAGWELGPLILKPIIALLFGAVNGLIGLVQVLYFPAKAQLNRDERIEKKGGAGKKGGTAEISYQDICALVNTVTPTYRQKYQGFASHLNGISDFDMFWEEIEDDREYMLKYDPLYQSILDEADTALWQQKQAYNKVRQKGEKDLAKSEKMRDFFQNTAWVGAESSWEIEYEMESADRDYEQNVKYWDETFSEEKKAYAAQHRLTQAIRKRVALETLYQANTFDDEEEEDDYDDEEEAYDDFDDFDDFDEDDFSDE